MQQSEVVFVLTGFKQVLSFRVFSFERRGVVPISISTVRADLELARKHGIPIQELPLLCRRVLECATNGSDALCLNYSEAAMLACADARRAEHELAARKKLWKPRPDADAPVSSFGRYWR